jgi:hypothetical protein
LQFTGSKHRAWTQTSQLRFELHCCCISTSNIALLYYRMCNISLLYKIEFRYNVLLNWEIYVFFGRKLTRTFDLIHISFATKFIMTLIVQNCCLKILYIITKLSNFKSLDYKHWDSKTKSNLCTTTTLGTLKLWPLLTGGRNSEEVISTLLFVIASKSETILYVTVYPTNIFNIKVFDKKTLFTYISYLAQSSNKEWFQKENRTLFCINHIM